MSEKEALELLGNYAIGYCAKEYRTTDEVVKALVLISAALNKHSTTLEENKEAILALRAVTPEGYVLVPVEPTDKMVKAGMFEKNDYYPSYEGSAEFNNDIYKAMIQAAQEEE